MLSNEQFEKGLQGLLSRKFPSNVEALIALVRFREIANAGGYRGRISKYQAVNGTITDNPKLIALERATAKTQKAAIPRARQEQARTSTPAPKMIRQETPKPPKPAPPPTPQDKDEAPKPIETNKAKKAEMAAAKEQESSVGKTRKGGPKPRALKRDEKKLKTTKAKKAKPNRYKH